MGSGARAHDAAPALAVVLEEQTFLSPERGSPLHTLTGAAYARPRPPGAAPATSAAGAPPGLHLVHGPPPGLATATTTRDLDADGRPYAERVCRGDGRTLSNTRRSIDGARSGGELREASSG